ncbi:hypothetical protein MMC31_005330 [Peltigera leucophlebia]|nr:hypothetical protein [Peltigera leucophlebia]
MARGGLRARTQVPGTPSDGSLSDSTLSDPPTTPVPSHARAHHRAALPASPPSRRPPPPPPARTPPPVPGQIRDPPKTAPFFSNANGLTEVQRARLFEIELEKSKQQMRQAAAAANQAERLQQASEEKVLLEMEYLRTEGDARLAALNTRREPGTQGMQDRARNDVDDGLGETTPSEVSARRDMFSGLPEEEIVKIFKNKFKPMNLYKLRHLHGFEKTQEEDGIVVENHTLKPRKTTGTFKDFGKSVNEVWSESFVNYMLVINILFGTPELSAALLLFYRQIMTLARSYDWLKGVLPVAIGWHKYAVIRSPLDPSNWKIAHDYQVSYCIDVTVRSSQLLGGTKRQRSSSPSSRNKKKTPHNENSICEGFNGEGCHWKHCQRAHQCRKCSSKDHGAKDFKKKLA